MNRIIVATATVAFLCIVILGIGIYYVSSTWIGKQSCTELLAANGRAITTDGSLSSIPEVPNSHLKYRVTGASSVAFLVDFTFDEEYHNYGYEVDAGNKLEGCLYLEPPPERTNVTVTITAISETGKRSQPFIFTNQDWWRAVAHSTEGYALEHVFRF